MYKLLLIIIMFICCNCYGQQVSGIVTDKQTGQAISGALITSLKATALSDFHGVFTINTKELNDTIRVTMQGYKLYQIAKPATNSAIIIALDKQAIELKEVKIFGTRDRVADSLNNRKMFAKSFNATPPKFRDIVKVEVSNGPFPVAGVTIIPSEFIKAVTYKHSKEYKFKKVLLRDEEDKYVNSRFSKALLKQLTDLQTDSLAIFMDRYRPTILTIKKMTDYDLRIYIKKSLISFKRNS